MLFWLNKTFRAGEFSFFFIFFFFLKEYKGCQLKASLSFGDDKSTLDLC